MSPALQTKYESAMTTNDFSRVLLRSACTALLALALVACGGGVEGDGTATSPAATLPVAPVLGSGTAPPAPSATSISAVPGGTGQPGGTVDGPGGAQLLVRAGALAAPLALAITPSADGAPPLPPGGRSVSAVYALTPHGTTFSSAVTVRVPFDPRSVAAGEPLALWKTNAARDGWEAVAGAMVSGNTVEAQIGTFSWIVVVATPALPTIAAQAEPQWASVTAQPVPPTITAQPAARSVVEPDAASFTIGATGPTTAGILSFQWKRNGVAIAGATRSTYSTGPTSVAADNGAVYSADVTNRAGTVASSTAALTVNAGSVATATTPPPADIRSPAPEPAPAQAPAPQVVVAPAITQQPADASVAVGASATFSAIVSGTSPALQWQRSNDGGATFADIAGANAASFTLANAQRADGGARFRLRASNSAGSSDSAAATLTVTAPALVASGPPKLAAGADFSLAADASGLAYSWGSDGAATLGGGSSRGNRSTAMPIGTLTGVRSVSAANAGVAVRADGTVWVWGYSGYIDCGFGATYDTPVQIAGAADIVAASMGESHTLLLRRDGVVLSFGCNDQGQLGRSGTVAPKSPPAPVAGLPKIVAVAAGEGYSLALDIDGFVWAWGRAGARGDGFGEFGPARSTPAQLLNLNRVIAIAAGKQHALALRENGLVAAWGSNESGELGVGDNSEHRIAFGTLLTSGITAIAAGRGTSLAVRADGAVLSWGMNNYGQLGTGSRTPISRSTPGVVTGIGGAIAVAVGTGRTHALALRSDGTVWAWGNNGSGQLGDGTTIERLTPVPVTGLNLN